MKSKSKNVLNRTNYINDNKIGQIRVLDTESGIVV